MSDINLLNDPGIQNEEISRIKKKSFDWKKEEIHEKIDMVNKPTEWNFSFLGIILLSLVLLTILFYNREHKIEVENSNFSISYLLNMLYDGHDKVQLNSINHNNKNINIVIEVNTEEKLYEKIDFFRNFNFNVKGTIISEKFFIYIKESWSLTQNSEWNLIKFQKYIKDFKGIEYELFNDKIIIISSIVDLISIINVCEKQNIMNHYLFDISRIKNDSNNNYYKLIIENYD